MLKKRIITTMLWNGTTLVKGHNFNNSRRAGSPITTIKIYKIGCLVGSPVKCLNKNEDWI